MAKSVPLRVPLDLFKEAERQGALSQRSATQQIEHWARLGRLLSPHISPAMELKLHAGLVHVGFEEHESPRVNLDGIFEDVDQKRESGELSHALVTHLPRYQASSKHQGLLEEMRPDGEVRVGQFKDGVFIEISTQ